MVPYSDYKRLEAQGVVFNARGFPLIYDVIGLNEIAQVDPYSMQGGNLIKLTNKLERFPPMHGLFLPQKIIVYVNSVDFLDDIYVKKNAYYTKDQWLDDLAADRTPDHSKTLSSLHTQSVEFPKRRKVISQAFFKSKIAGLAKTIARVTLG